MRFLPNVPEYDAVLLQAVGIAGIVRGMYTRSMTEIRCLQDGRREKSIEAFTAEDS